MKVYCSSIKCDICGKDCRKSGEIYDAQVIVGRKTWAYCCPTCYMMFHCSSAEPFVWSEKEHKFIKERKPSAVQQMLMDELGLSEEEVLDC